MKFLQDLVPGCSKVSGVLLIMCIIDNVLTLANQFFMFLLAGNWKSRYAGRNNQLCPITTKAG